MGLSASSSKINIEDNNNFIKDDLVNVNFIQLKQLSNCVVTPDQLNLLLGLSVPKYSVLEGTEYPYLFCVSGLVDINTIVKEYKYQIGFSTIQKVFRNEFNSSHRATIAYNYNEPEYYKLEPV